MSRTIIFKNHNTHHDKMFGKMPAKRVRKTFEFGNNLHWTRFINLAFHDHASCYLQIVGELQFVVV